MVEPLEFFVQGSSLEPYNVRIRRVGERILATCTCKAGIMRQLCKHRIRILQGDSQGLVSGNLEQVLNMPSFLEGTVVLNAIRQIARLEEEVEEAKRILARAKEALAKSFYESASLIV
jgi:hypothetical protein